jgi:L-ascorbate metabolism protein UlaG (beta-lactamase superfamily)
MEITWYGLSCFKLVERNSATVITDPYDARQTGYSQMKQTADIVTISHESPGHNCLEAVAGKPYVINGPGEYEVGGVFITGIQTGGQKGADDFRNTLYVFDYNSLTVAHLGDLNRVPTQAEVEALGQVNILLVPVGGGKSLTAARAAEVVSLLEPNIVIPMHYATPECLISLDGLSKFLKEMGINESEKQPSLKVSDITAQEETKVVVLEHQHR